MNRFRATLAYDGTAYLGFQRQAGSAPTIQAAIENALSQITQTPITVIGAGRTDAGVHAEGQVIAFDCVWRHDEAALLRAINSLLPRDIALMDIERCGSRFHPRFDAASRVYQYEIVIAPTRLPLLARTAWWLSSPLAGKALDEAAAVIIGTHDCGAFGHPPQGENTVRTIVRSQWERWEEVGRTRWRYTVEANAFLHHMVRRIVGMLTDVGRGTHTLAEFRAVFAAATLVKNWTIAPPQGLTLVRVNYPDVGQQGQECAGETPAGGH